MIYGVEGTTVHQPLVVVWRGIGVGCEALYSPMTRCQSLKELVPLVNVLHKRFSGFLSPS